MPSSRRESGLFALALAGTGGHVVLQVVQGPQASGGTPPSAAIWLANQLGFWALAWLAATLACTPLQQWAGWQWPLRWRKRLGITAFALATLHVGVWVIGEHGMSPVKMAKEWLATPWQWFGALAWILLASLAATTPARVAKKIGGRRWKIWHKAIYVAALAAVLHYALRREATPLHWIGFAVVIAALLLARLARLPRRHLSR